MSSTDRRGAPDPPGTVAVLFSGRHSRIFQTLNDLELPDGSVKTFWGGSRGSRCQDLNDMVAEALRTRSYWVWFISEDYGFERNILMNLLSRNEAMVAPISVEGYDPYLPKAWNDVGDEGIITPLQLNQVVGPASLIDVRGASVTGMLVRRAVFEAMAPPWFRMTETMTEDVYFNERAREVGFQAYIDTESRLSTLSVAAMTPQHKGGRWELGVDVGDDMHFTQPLKHR